MNLNFIFFVFVMLFIYNRTEMIVVAVTSTALHSINMLYQSFVEFIVLPSLINKSKEFLFIVQLYFLYKAMYDGLKEVDNMFVVCVFNFFFMVYGIQRNAITNIKTFFFLFCETLQRLFKFIIGENCDSFEFQALYANYW